MRLQKLVALSVAILASVVVMLAQGPGEGGSLADLARQQRAKRMKVMQERSVRVWTNDNIPKQPRSAGPTAAAGMSATPMTPAEEAVVTTEPPATGEQGSGTAAAESAAQSPSGSVHDEKYYREEMARLRSRLDLHQRELSVLQQKQAQGQMQFYADPNKALQQEYSRSDINERNDEIAKKQEQIAADQQAIQDLQDQLRREGHPPGWLR